MVQGCKEFSVMPCELPIAVLTNHHTLKGLKLCAPAISQLQSPEVWVSLAIFFNLGFISLKSRGQLDYIFIQKLGKDPFPSLFQVQK